MRLPLRERIIVALVILGAVAAGPCLASGNPGFVITPERTRLEVFVPADEKTLEVRPLAREQEGAPLMGRTERTGAGVAFMPAVPLLPGERYRVRWRSASGETHVFDTTTAPAAPQPAPSVSLLPQAPLPANALKIYLHFSEPMEQGVFLDRLHLINGDGHEIAGPFRETELWSPDSKRLTVWFHPGRQKTGVNLNLDEGPVLRPGSVYKLVVDGTWRSTSGVPIGADQVFQLGTVEADHECPKMSAWTLTVPGAGTQEPLRVRFDEALDPAMLPTALRIFRRGETKETAGEVQAPPSATHWTFTPEEAWGAGSYELRAEAHLEDLAGNSLTKPFEVNLAVPTETAGAAVMEFEVGGGG